MRHHHTFIEGVFKFAFCKVLMNCAEWWSLLERAVAGAAQRMATPAIDHRERLSFGNIIGQKRCTGKDNDNDRYGVTHVSTLASTQSCTIPNCQLPTIFILIFRTG